MIINKVRATVLASVAVLTLGAGSQAFAGTVFETASAGGSTGSQNTYTAYGDGTDGGSNFIGASFQLASSVSSLQVGANIDAFSIGSAFAEVVKVDPTTGLPAVTGSGSSSLITWLGNNSLGEATFTPSSTAGDASTVINFATPLAAGSYAVIVGSGLFGATGDAFGDAGQINLTDTNTTVGNPTIFSSLGADTFADANYPGARIFAETAPVPLPASLWLMLGGIGGLVGVARRKRKT